MNSKILNKNIYSFYLSFSLIIIASSLPHAVLTVILLDKGINLSKIMLIQASYNLAIIISEYPSGLMADIFSKKKLFIISKFFIIVMFILIIYTSNFLFMAIAWFIYGISNALDSGTIDAKIINDIKVLGSNKKLDKFISNSNIINFGSLLLGSTIGSFFYYKIGINFYWISILLTIFSLIIIKYFYFDNENTNAFTNISIIKVLKELPNKMLLQSKEGLIELKSSFSLKSMILLSFFGQFFFQTHFQLWQATFLFKNIDKHSFYIYYIIFQILSIIAYKMPIKKLFKKNINLYIFSLLMFVSLSGIFSNKNFIFMFSYVFMIFCFTVFDYLSNYLFAKKVSEEHISSLTSLKSTVSRIASLLSLIFSSLLLTFQNVILVDFLNFLFAIVTSVFVVINYVTKEKI